MLKLTITYLAGALSFACLPALAVDLPDYGSKNFSPSDETPSYFANEAAPVSARTADTTQGDWSAVDEMAPARPAFEGPRSAHGHRRHHVDMPSSKTPADTARPNTARPDTAAGRSGRRARSTAGRAPDTRVLVWRIIR
jgi:hypothetical protein